MSEFGNDLPPYDPQRRREGTWRTGKWGRRPGRQQRRTGRKPGRPPREAYPGEVP